MANDETLSGVKEEINMKGKESKNMEKEDRILLAGIEDRMRRSEERYMLTSTAFLDLRQRSLAETFLKGFGGVNFCFYGGYEDAERTVCVFFPEGFMEGKSPEEHFAAIPEEDPLAAVRAIRKKGAPPLSHRDYLGALMGLGIRRESVGDILVREDGADIILLKEIADFVLMNYSKAGRTPLELSGIPVSGLIFRAGERREVTESVASLRLDNLVSAAFSVSRSRAAEAAAEGLIFIDGISVKKPDRIIREGEKIVFRGRGKAVFLGVKGKSSKGRLIVAIEKYI